MHILVDENIPLMTVQALRSKGHDIHDLRGTVDEGVTDENVWRLAQQEKRVLITTDKGFVHHRGEHHSGVLIVLLKQPNRVKIHERVLQALSQYQAEQWPGLLMVMRDTVQSVSRANE
jgi:predicted nuclease of predicted toxin-antitoxin system